MNGFKKNRLHEIFTVSKIVTILYQKFPRDFVFPGESHDFWEFICAEKGEILISTDSTEYLLKAGELAFHKPDEFHSVRATGHSPSTAIVVSFECRSTGMQFFENKILFIDEQELLILNRILKEGESAFEKLSTKPPYMGMRRKRNVTPGAEQIIKLYLELFLIHIYRRKAVIMRSERYTLSPGQMIDKKLTEDILAYLGRNMHTGVTLGEISHQLGVSTSKIKKAFKSQTGKSVIEYFNDLRITESKRLIREKELNFTQIAEKLGFRTIHYFSRMFRLKTGMTPTGYLRTLE